jgi:transcriptional regulator with XRE-family HTH domain
MNTLGKRLKAARKNKGMMQRELELKSGVSQQLISKIENEKIDSTTEVFALSEALGISARWLSTGNGEMIEEHGQVQDAAQATDGLTDEAVMFARAFQELPPEQRAVLQQTAQAFMDSTKKQTSKVA